jgi:hypothetical protein
VTLRATAAASRARAREEETGTLSYRRGPPKVEDSDEAAESGAAGDVVDVLLPGRSTGVEGDFVELRQGVLRITKGN